MKKYLLRNVCQGLFQLSQEYLWGPLITSNSLNHINLNSKFESTMNNIYCSRIIHSIPVEVMGKSFGMDYCDQAKVLKYDLAR